MITRNNIIVEENEGDKKTPEGVYDLTSKNTKLDEFYRPFDLVTSYSNTFDKSLNKKGYGFGFIVCL